MARQDRRSADRSGPTDAHKRPNGRFRFILRGLKSPSWTAQAYAVQNHRHSGPDPAALVAAQRPYGLSGLAHDRRGVAAIEMAAVAPFLVLMVVTFADFGRATSQRIDINTALRAGAQHAVTASSDNAQVEATVREALPAQLRNNASMSVSATCYCGVLAAGSTDLPPVAPCANACPTPRAKMMMVQASVNFTPLNFVFGSVYEFTNLSRISDSVTIRSQ